jgi:hypothetical protein
VFTANGSVTRVHGANRFAGEGEDFLVAATALRTEEDPDLYDVHTTVFRVNDASLAVVCDPDRSVTKRSGDIRDVPDTCVTPPE